PIAIFVNALRVAVLGWLHLIDPALAQGDFHIFVGMLMLIPAAGLLMLVGWCLEKMLIVEGKRPKGPPPLPYEDDPRAIHFDPATVVRGVVMGGVAVVLLGVCYLLLINNRTGGTVIEWLSMGLNNALLAVSGVALLIGIVLAWRSILKSNRPGQLALSQGLIGGLLLVAALGQTSVINATGVALTKLPLPLREGIALSFPDQAGDWELLHLDPKLPKDVEAELGTKEYFNRFYVDNDAGVYRDSVEVFTLDNEPGGRLKNWRGEIAPGELAKVHVTYYTGMLDTVPHVPDKCWVVAGSEQVYRQTHKIKIDRSDYRPDPDHPGLILAESRAFDKTVRLPGDEIECVIFSGRDSFGNVSTAMYFFLANGDAIASSHQVRFSFNLKDRYSYYCKVELMFPGIVIRNSDDAEGIEKMKALASDMLSDLLPEVMACLPDWTEVQAGEYPETE
ncbi:MAG: archaeosortase/exosortase family protein, partial [Phycisphaeraceae bacterium]